MSALMASTPLMAADYSFSGQSSTILRMKTTVDRGDNYPVYEYLRFALNDDRADGTGVSFLLGAWGRIDLADRSSERYSDGDLQYAYLTYRGGRNNLVVNFGRQFVSEGVASERLDGLYLRSDFLAGVGAAAYAGKPVISQTTYKGADTVYGGRVTHSMPAWYTAGASVLKSDGENGSAYREEYGVDLWLHPHKMVDVTGRSSYNALTGGWMEHAYTISASPLDNLRASIDISNINYRDYFHNVTTSALSYTSRMIDPNEQLTAVGITLGYTPVKNLTVTGEYKNYGYEVAGSADYYGARATYLFPDALSTGCAVHRMEGSTGRLRYADYRLFASKKFGHADLAADLMMIRFDRAINGLQNSYTLTGSAGYEVSHSVKIGADLEFSKNPDFDGEVRGMVKLTYLFDTNRAEGGGKREK